MNKQFLLTVPMNFTCKESIWGCQLSAVEMESLVVRKTKTSKVNGWSNSYISCDFQLLKQKKSTEFIGARTFEFTFYFTYGTRWLTICLMNPEEHPLNIEASLTYGSYKFCEICTEEKTNCSTDIIFKNFYNSIRHQKKTGTCNKQYKINI